LGVASSLTMNELRRLLPTPPRGGLWACGWL